MSRYYTRYMRVLHIITGLGVGGAETMLCKLLAAMTDHPVSSHVISLTDGGELAGKIEGLGVPVESVGMAGLADAPRTLLRLARRIREINPDVVQTWMYHGDLIGGLATWCARQGGRKIPIVWNIRLSEVDPKFVKWSTRLIIRCLALLSARMPAAILANARASLTTHQAMGYAPHKFVLIPNGFDLAQFKPDIDARAELRRELGVPQDAILVGKAGRFDAQKDYPSFLAAVRRVTTARPDVVFLACGSGVTDTNPEMCALVGAPLPNLHLLGKRTDMSRVHAALDVAVSTSIGEGFANAIGEAMCCAVPCVVTNVGDSKDIVGDCGITVAPSDPEAVTNAILELVGMSAAERQALGKRARARVAQKYDIDRIAQDFRNVWNRVRAGTTEQVVG